MSTNQRGRKLALTIDNPQRNNVKSAKQDKYFTLKKSISNETYDSKDESSNEFLSRILDTINSNSLNIFYPDSNSEFKKKIDSLNLKFYLETEKYLSNKNRSEKCQTSLFIILFKQINIYIEEIERLNLIIIKRKYDPKKIIERTDELIKKQNEFLTKEKLIKTLKESKSNIESKLLESIINEDKLKKEIQYLKKENALFKKQLSHKVNTSHNKIIHNNLKKENSNDLLHKLTHPTFHSSTIKNLIHEGIGGPYTSKEKNNYYYNQGYENGGIAKKRNNSDNKKIILNNSFKKFDKIIGKNINFGNMVKGGKLLFKNCQKNKENSGVHENNSVSNNTNNTSHNKISNNPPTTTSKNYINKKTIHIKLNNEIGFNSNSNNNYININMNNTQTIGATNSKPNLDYSDFKPLKTDYTVSDLEEYKKGFLYENNCPEIKKNKEIKINFCCSKSKEKKDIINLNEKDGMNILNKKIKENFISSAKQISNTIGKTERRKKQKINI